MPGGLQSPLPGPGLQSARMSDAQEPQPGGGDEKGSADLPMVPLFPLPNVVLFPRAVLPLHIFEERYKAMTGHALEGDRQIAMALLKPGWEKHYYSRPAIEPVICVGRILSHERLPDGTYNFLLQGTARARIVREICCSEPYRLGGIEPLSDVPADEEFLADARRRMAEAFTEGPFSGTALGRQFLRLLSTPLATPELADLIAFSFLDDVTLKQSLLAEADVARRISTTLDELDQQRPVEIAPSVRAYRHPGVN
jgi:Lon protease-like protein